MFEVNKIDYNSLRKYKIKKELVLMSPEEWKELHEMVIADISEMEYLDHMLPSEGIVKGNKENTTLGEGEE